MFTVNSRASEVNGVDSSCNNNTSMTLMEVKRKRFFDDYVVENIQQLCDTSGSVEECEMFLPTQSCTLKFSTLSSLYLNRNLPTKTIDDDSPCIKSGSAPTLESCCHVNKRRRVMYNDTSDDDTDSDTTSFGGYEREGVAHHDDSTDTPFLITQSQFDTTNSTESPPNQNEDKTFINKNQTVVIDAQSGQNAAYEKEMELLMDELTSCSFAWKTNNDTHNPSNIKDKAFPRHGDDNVDIKEKENPETLEKIREKPLATEVATGSWCLYNLKSIRDDFISNRTYTSRKYTNEEFKNQKEQSFQNYKEYSFSRESKQEFCKVKRRQAIRLMKRRGACSFS